MSAAVCAAGTFALGGCKAGGSITEFDGTVPVEQPASIEPAVSYEPVLSPAGFDFATGTVLLNSGYAMPILGLGTWTLPNDRAEESTLAALRAGMRLVDTARYYRCEAGVGRGVAAAVREGIVSREEVFVTSKIMPSDAKRAAKAIDESLADLGLSYLDLMLIHQPGAHDEAMYKVMEDAVAAGKVRSIGISNYYTPAALDEVLSYATITPAVIQNENHLRYGNAELRDYAAKWGIVMESWYPFGGRAHVREHLGNSTVADIARAHGKSAAQIITRWQLQSGYVCIPGSSSAAHIAENAAVFDFALSEEEMTWLSALDTGRRYENW